MQALCMQHIVKASPIGEMILAEDFTRGKEFTRWWNRRQLHSDGTSAIDVGG